MSAPGSRGFSLVELMVAMTLSLILLGGVLSVTYGSKVTYNQNERVGRLQENGRGAVELMLRDMRAGGFHGCARTVAFVTTLTDSNTLLWDFSSPTKGYESGGAGAWIPALDLLIDSPRDGSDAIAIRTVRSNMPSLVTNGAMATSTSDITVDKSAADTLRDGQPVMVSDCNSTAVFAVSTFSDSGTTATLAHAAGVPVPGIGPGNASDDLGFLFGPGAQVVPLDTVIYYIRDSDTVRNGVRNPALWRIVGGGAAQELIEGIENMQILYGLDTDGDRLVNSYLTADAIADTDWVNVISVSFALLIRSAEPNAPQADTRTYTLLGTAMGPFNDRYERTLYTTTVTLRNNTN